MAIIDIDSMYREMYNTMDNNFKGTLPMRFRRAKKLFLESVAQAIDDNKEGLIKEMKEELY